MRLQKFVFTGMIFIFAGVFALPAESSGCWVYQDHLTVECCFVCCETEDD